MNCGRLLVAWTGGSDEPGDVIDRVVGDRHRGDQLLEVRDRLGREHLLEFGGFSLGGRGEDLLLFFVRWVADPDIEHEAVELGFGQGVGAFLLDGILGGDDEERVREVQGLLADGDLTLLHGLEQRGLGLGRGPVDLVGEDDVREDRARDEPEAPTTGFGFFEDVRAR